MRPPPALDCAHVVEFAVLDETVVFEQRKTLNVGGEWLGQVPCLAICQNLDETEFLIFYCDLNWETLGVAAGYKFDRGGQAASGAFLSWFDAQLDADGLLAGRCSYIP